MHFHKKTRRSCIKMTEIYLNDVMQFAKSLNARVASERDKSSQKDLAERLWMYERRRE